MGQPHLAVCAFYSEVPGSCLRAGHGDKHSESGLEVHKPTHRRTVIRTMLGISARR